MPTLQQEGQLSIILDQIIRERNISPKMICGWDSNLDIIIEKHNSDIYDIRNILQEYRNFLENHDFTLLKIELTGHWIGNKNSLLDHLITKKPAH